MEKNSYDIVIIGGGIIGCALARELGRRFDSVLLIEKENAVGFHTSGRNSGVVHSGFNPKPGTLKARLCVEGNRQTRQYCEKRQIPCHQVGTFVVALDKAQLPVLYDLKSRGEKNGVPGLEILTLDRVRDAEPNAKGIAALFSPTGAIVDSEALTRGLAREAQERGVAVALDHQVIRVEERSDAVVLSTQRGSYTAKMVVNCAGLHADRLAHMMGVGRDYIIAPFRGEYFVVSRSGPPIVRSMLYPVPNPLVPFLGIHLTRTVAGTVLIGPNAVPAFGREAYHGFGVNIQELAEIARHKGVWNALIRNRTLIRIAWNELLHTCSKRHFLAEASRLVAGLSLRDLKWGRRAGIRPQLIKYDGHLVENLVIEATTHSIHLLNVVSPGMTSSLAFADWFNRHIDNNLTWTGPTAVTAN